MPRVPKTKGQGSQSDTIKRSAGLIAGEIDPEMLLGQNVQQFISGRAGATESLRPEFKE